MDNELPNGIREVGNSTIHNLRFEAIYDVSGRRIANEELNMNNGKIPKGIYIIHGRKVLVK